MSFTTTVIFAPLFNIGMLKSRGSRRGFSLSMMVGFVLLSAGFWVWMWVSDGFFRQPLFWLVAAGNLAMTLAGVVYFQKMPAYRPVA